MRKKCSQCEIVKLNNEFAKDRGKKDGLRCYCKDCGNVVTGKYKKSKIGMVAVVYSHQRRNSKHRDYAMPTYSLEELRAWCFSQKLFHELYDNWKSSGFEKDLTPSFDRIDDYSSYTLSNLQLMTWAENNQRAYNDKKAGINNKNNKSVIGRCMETGNKVEFYSQSEAGRKIGVHQASVSACCLGKIKSIGGYEWEFSDN